jgi:hypothetical protein
MRSEEYVRSLLEKYVKYLETTRKELERFNNDYKTYGPYINEARDEAQRFTLIISLLEDIVKDDNS